MARRTLYAGTKGNVNNVNVILTDYNKLKNYLKKDVRRILTKAGRMVIEYTEPLVPLEFGGLRKSGRVRVKDNKKGLAVEVSYGGVDNPVTPTPNAPEGIVNYALVVHEDLEAEHPVGQAKYLEVGSIKAKPHVDRYILDELAKAPLRKR